jgi:hypothetical protein
MEYKWDESWIICDATYISWWFVGLLVSRAVIEVPAAVMHRWAKIRWLWRLVWIELFSNFWRNPTFSRTAMGFAIWNTNLNFTVNPHCCITYEWPKLLSNLRWLVNISRRTEDRRCHNYLQCLHNSALWGSVCSASCTGPSALRLLDLPVRKWIITGIPK